MLMLLLALTVSQPCLTRCGVISLSADCGELQALETDSLAAFEWYAGLKRERSCKALQTWGVVIHTYDSVDRARCTYPSWDAAGLCVIGYTWEERHFMEVQRGALQTSALAHELLHVIIGPGHCHWLEFGIKKALQAVTGEWDPSRTEEECPRFQPHTPPAPLREQ